MRKLVPLFLLASVTGCVTPEKEKEKTTTEKRVVVNDTVPAERTAVNPRPVAAWRATVPDELNEFEFSVRLYETPLRFRYRADIIYKTMQVKDTVDIPNFGHQPRPDVRRLGNDLSCMIGFYDAENSFRDLKKVEIIDNQLKIVQVRRYGIGTVKKK